MHGQRAGRVARPVVAAALCLAVLGAAGACRAEALGLCEGARTASAAEQDRALRLAAAVKAELAEAGAGMAIIARSGLDLARFGFRHSHAGFALPPADGARGWSVRQLYYACDEGRPRLFDQGLAGFLLGAGDEAPAYATLVLLPADAAGGLERAARDDALALQLLGADYSANAYVFALRYQNCNQWVAEMLAVGWGASTPTRASAQRWLREAGYEPGVFDGAAQPLAWFASALVPHVHADDHPAEDLAQRRYRVSMPSALEAFVRARLPEARRVELCRTERHIVVHRGWEPIAEGCVAGRGDTLIALD